MRNILLLFASLCFAILCVGCGSDSAKDNSEDCSDVVCTSKFSFISVKIVSADGTPIILDSYEVIEVATGKVRDVPNLGAVSHVYTIASDLDKEEFFNKEVELQFIGKLGGKALVTQNYVVSGSCCGTYLVDGNTEIVIRP